MASPFAEPAAPARSTLPSAGGLTAVAAATTLVTAALMSEHAATNGPVICPFRLLTGLPCPGCGMTRAWVFALHGNLGRALAENPFVLVTLPLAVVFVMVGVRAALTHDRTPNPTQLLRRITSGAAGRWALRLVVASWIGFGIVRALLVATGWVAA